MIAFYRMGYFENNHLQSRCLSMFGAYTLSIHLIIAKTVCGIVTNAEAPKAKYKTLSRLTLFICTVYKIPYYSKNYVTYQLLLPSAYAFYHSLAFQNSKMALHDNSPEDRYPSYVSGIV